MYLLLFIFYFLEDSKIMIPKKKSVKKISFSPNTNQNYSIS